ADSHWSSQNRRRDSFLWPPPNRRPGSRVGEVADHSNRTCPRPPDPTSTTQTHRSSNSVRSDFHSCGTTFLASWIYRSRENHPRTFRAMRATGFGWNSAARLSPDGHVSPAVRFRPRSSLSSAACATARKELLLAAIFISSASVIEE